MDTLAIPTGAPNRDLAYKLIGQSISPEVQKNIADALTQAVITKAAHAAHRRAQQEDLHQNDNLLPCSNGRAPSLLAARTRGRFRGRMSRCRRNTSAS